jgi:hypothetical protein
MRNGFVSTKKGRSGSVDASENHLFQRRPKRIIIFPNTFFTSPNFRRS